MTTRAQLQEKSIAELREIAAAVGIETDGLQKSRLISRIMELQGGDADGEAPVEVDLPAATPRSGDNGSEKPDTENATETGTEETADGGPAREAEGDSTPAEVGTAGSEETAEASSDDESGDDDDDNRGNRRRRKRNRNRQDRPAQEPEGEPEVREGLLDILPE